MENQKEHLTSYQSSLQSFADPNEDIVEKVVKINGEQIEKVYIREKLLGRGGFAECYQTLQKDTHARAATKIIPKKLLQSPRTKFRLANQIRLHQSLHHENVVQFYTNFEDRNNIYINLQLCQNGSINDLLAERQELSTPEIQSFLYGLCQGLKYLHSRLIIHRDMKLGNLFLDADNKVKIGDFGLAAKLQFDREKKRTVCGTPNYIAPEVLQAKGYDFSIDVWAVGVMIYSLYYTIPPFETEQAFTTYEKIRNCDYIIPKNNNVPPQAIDLIKRILVADVCKRLNLDEILNSSFMKLGKGIPQGLPPCILKKAPSQKELSRWPLLLVKNESSDPVQKMPLGRLMQIKSKQKSRVLRNCKSVSSIPSMSPIESLTHACFLQQIEKSLFFFILNNGNYGLIDLAKSTVHFRGFKKGTNENIIKRGSINQKQQCQFFQMPLEEYSRKVLLAIKVKECEGFFAKLFPSSQHEEVMITKFSEYKEMKMMRLSNRVVQLMFQEGDGFLFNQSALKMHYYGCFAEMEKGAEVDLHELRKFQGGKQNSQTEGKKHPTLNGLFKCSLDSEWPISSKKIQYAYKIFEEVLSRHLKKY